MKLALKWFVPITLTAMGLAWLSEQVALLLGFEPPPQDLVKLFTDPNVAWQIKFKYGVIAVGVAPVLEEFIFRMGLFRLCGWLGRRFRRKASGTTSAATSGAVVFPVVSALVSGAVFAAVHLHAATFVPLWFLGVAFAWLYWKSGTVFSPMLCHILFNLVNLVLCLVLGAEAA